MQQSKLNMDLNESRAATFQPLFVLLEDGSGLSHAHTGFQLAKRTADVVCSLVILILAFPLLLAIAFLVRLSSPGPVIFWSTRFGRYNRPFAMPKFRTMYTGTPEVPSVDLGAAESCITPIGRMLRRTSLDELPQLWSVLIGDMSLIGPRPVICAEVELAERRASVGVDELAPGITGWAQVHGRDCVGVEEKVSLDRYYLQNRSVQMDLQILYATVSCVFSGSGILH